MTTPLITRAKEQILSWVYWKDQWLSENAPHYPPNALESEKEFLATIRQLCEAVVEAEKAMKKSLSAMHLEVCEPIGQCYCGSIELSKWLDKYSTNGKK